MKPRMGSTTIRIAFAGFAIAILALTPSLGYSTQVGSRQSTPGPTSQYSAWQQEVTNLPLPSAGCYAATYPVVAWVGGESSCIPRPNPSGVFAVGDGNDYDASISSGYIGESQGYVTYESGISTESDNGQGTGTNYYSIQINSNPFSCNTPDTGNVAATCLEQFIFANPGSGNGYVQIEYWLLNYLSGSRLNCPSTSTYLVSPGWSNPSIAQGGRSCTAFSITGSVGSTESPLSLASYQVKGYADNGGYDEPVFCSGSTCHAIANNYGVLDLNAGWTASEWNVLGYQDSSTACFNGTPSNCVQSGYPLLDVDQYLYNSAGTSIASSCLSTSSLGWYTQEQNDLTLSNTCTASTGGSPYFIYFAMT